MGYLGGFDHQVINLWGFRSDGFVSRLRCFALGYAAIAELKAQACLEQRSTIGTNVTFTQKRNCNLCKQEQYPIYRRHLQGLWRSSDSNGTTSTMTGRLQLLQLVVGQMILVDQLTRRKLQKVQVLLWQLLTSSNRCGRGYN